MTKRERMLASIARRWRRLYMSTVSGGYFFNETLKPFHDPGFIRRNLKITRAQRQRHIPLGMGAGIGGQQ